MGTIKDSVKKVWAMKTVRMIVISLGIIVCFLYFGIIQERVTKGCFGGEYIDNDCSGDRFRFEMTLVFIFTFIYAIVARSES